MPPKSKKGGRGEPSLSQEGLERLRQENMMFRERHNEDLVAFETQQFDYTFQEEHEDLGVDIHAHPTKGRVLVATRSYQPGDVIFKERAFVVASWSEYHCIECMKPHKPTKCERVKARYCHKMRENLSTLENMLADYDEIGEIDRARCFIKVLKLLDSNPEAKPIEAFLQLAPNKLEECIAAVEKMRSRNLPRVCEMFPPNVDNDTAGRILAILNCNSHQIENVGGSGVFLQASMMEHSCVPNCNFVTQDEDIFVIAIAPVQAGDALSIDYAQAFYRPVTERRAALERSHGFLCDCDGCFNQRDRCRAFHCPMAVTNRSNGVPTFVPSLGRSRPSPSECTSGIVHPTGVADLSSLPPDADAALADLGLDWSCETCGYVLNESEIRTCLEYEHQYPPPADDEEEEEEEEGHGDEDDAYGNDTAHLRAEVPSSGAGKRDLAEIDRIVGEEVMHESHYSLFHSLVKEGYVLAKVASAAASGIVSSDVKFDDDNTYNDNNNNNNNNSSMGRDMESMMNISAMIGGSGSTSGANKSRKRNGKERGQRVVSKKEKTQAWRKAEHVWLRIIAAAELVLPKYHPDKCNFLDHLGQVRVTGKAIAAAQQAWKAAYELSCIVAGKMTKQTLQLRGLYKKTPRTIEELVFRYDNTREAIDIIEYEDDQSSAHLVAQLAEAALQDIDAHADHDEEEEQKSRTSKGGKMGVGRGGNKHQEEEEGEEEDEDEDDDDDDDDYLLDEDARRTKEALRNAEKQRQGLGLAVARLTQTTPLTVAASSSSAAAASSAASSKPTSAGMVGGGFGSKGSSISSSNASTSSASASGTTLTGNAAKGSWGRPTPVSNVKEEEKKHQQQQQQQQQAGAFNLKFSSSFKPTSSNPFAALGGGGGAGRNGGGGNNNDDDDDDDDDEEDTGSKSKNKPSIFASRFNTNSSTSNTSSSTSGASQNRGAFSFNKR